MTALSVRVTVHEAIGSRIVLVHSAETFTTQLGRVEEVRLELEPLVGRDGLWTTGEIPRRSVGRVIPPLL